MSKPSFHITPIKPVISNKVTSAKIPYTQPKQINFFQASDFSGFFIFKLKNIYICATEMIIAHLHSGTSNKIPMTMDQAIS